MVCTRDRLGRFDFPFTLSPVARAFYEQTAQVEHGRTAADMKAILRLGQE